MQNRQRKGRGDGMASKRPVDPFYLSIPLWLGAVSKSHQLLPLPSLGSQPSLVFRRTLNTDWSEERKRPSGVWQQAKWSQKLGWFCAEKTLHQNYTCLLEIRNVLVLTPWGKSTCVWKILKYIMGKPTLSVWDIQLCPVFANHLNYPCWDSSTNLLSSMGLLPAKATHV